MLQPSRDCYIIKKETLFTSEGDTLQYEDESRPCERNQVQAFEFLNFSQIGPETQGQAGLVSAGIFIKDSALGTKSTKWREYTVFKAVNNFEWVPQAGAQEQFLGDDCRYDPNDSAYAQKAALREEIILRSLIAPF